MIDVSIIIVNYNTKKLTLECIESIKAKTKGVNYEIIVVDNCSKDGSIDLLKLYPGIKFIQSTTNLGFGGANNLGYSCAQGKYIFLLNSDTVLLNDAISMFYERMEKLPSKVACIGTWLLNEDGSVGLSYGYFLSIGYIWKSVRKIFHKKQPPIVNKDLFEVEVVLGADMFIRNTPDIINGEIFDRRYFMYNEENDFQYMLHKKGFVKMLITGPSIIHYGGRSDDGKMNANVIKSSFTYIKKWHCKFYYYIYRFLYAAVYIPRMLTNRKVKHERINLIETILTYRVQYD